MLFVMNLIGMVVMMALTISVSLFLMVAIFVVS
jgi:hypothetical protein